GKRFKELVQEFKDRFANPYIASQEGYIDDVIKPSETREKLIQALSVQKNKRVERPRRKHGNIPL
ncbi:MAG TPA: carboxyl transferase domain-containing protein, partial [Candidatus Obscuribacter sp.]|nr:carboxyl transferase domain-containing protein [Candidatus Obscuribacter sp.]